MSGGWPRVLSNLKSLLEAGEVAITEAEHHVLRAGDDLPGKSTRPTL